MSTLAGLLGKAGIGRTGRVTGQVAVARPSVVTAAGPPGVRVWLPDAYGARAFAAQLMKGAGHKYIKRVPVGTTKGGATRYRYYYEVQHGSGVHHEDHFVEGAAFRFEGGHYHVEKVDGDTLTIKHDETGETRKVTRGALSKMLSEHHGKAIDAHKAKVTADLATVERHGSDRQKARMREYAKQWGVDGARDTKPATKTHPAGTHEAGHQRVATGLVAAVEARGDTAAGDMIAARNKAFADVASGAKTIADLERDAQAEGPRSDKGRGMRIAAKKIGDMWAATDDSQKLRADQRRSDVNAQHSAKVDPHVADKAALEGWQKNDADAVTHIHKRAQELLPGVRMQDSHDVVSQHVYGGGVTDAYRERMARENRIVKPAKKVSEDAPKPAAGASTMPEGTRVALHPVGTDYMRGEKGTVMGDSPHLAGHVVVNFDNGKSLVVRAKDVKSTGEPPRPNGANDNDAAAANDAAERGLAANDSKPAGPYKTPNGRGGWVTWASKAEYEESMARREAMMAEVKVTNTASNEARESAFDAKPGHHVKSTDRMSNSGYHRSGKPNWWLRRTDAGPGNFVDIPRVRGDEKLDIKLDLEPGKYTAGAGRGSDGVRHSFTVPEKVQKSHGGLAALLHAALGTR